MLIKEYNHLLKCCKKIQSATKGIENTVDKILSETGRSFQISFDGVDYDFSKPTTLEELQQFEQLKEDFILKLLSKSYDDMLQSEKKDDECWDTILALAMGNPLEYYQIEKIKEENITNVSDSVEKIQDGVALNQDSVYVQWQDENKITFEEK